MAHSQSQRSHPSPSPTRSQPREGDRIRAVFTLVLCSIAISGTAAIIAILAGVTGNAFEAALGTGFTAVTLSLFVRLDVVIGRRRPRWFVITFGALDLHLLALFTIRATTVPY